MHVNPHRRAAAARLLLDAVVALDIEDGGTDAADNRALLALEPLGLDLPGEPRVAATLAGALDLLWFLTHKQAETTGLPQETLISNIREHVLPRVYPDVYGEQ
jgi:hypothetical protein